MFGRRYDGRRVADMDPIVRFTPYLMPMRCDSQVFLEQQVDYEPLARYIAKQNLRGNKITFMHIIIAVYVRAVGQFPELNRFIVNKQVFDRNYCSVSFSVLQQGKNDTVTENTAKVKFDPSDTLFDIAMRVETAIQEARAVDEDNSTMHVAKTLLGIPGLTTFAVRILMTLDKYGLMPKSVIEASPFHTSLFFVNMASIGMHRVYHHIYNFGTTSQFFSLGSVERAVQMDGTGKASRRRYLPIGITADERICTGEMYARCFSLMLSLLHHPEQLETPPESVKYLSQEYHLDKPIFDPQFLANPEPVSDETETA